MTEKEIEKEVRRIIDYNHTVGFYETFNNESAIEQLTEFIKSILK